MSDSTPRRTRKRPERKMSGPKNLFRGKVRQPISIALTKFGHRLMTRHVKRTGMSRSDYVESLLRLCGDKVPERPTETHGQDAPAAESG